jgi:hypothetical protein
VDGLEEMDNPLSIAEIDNIVKELPTSKSSSRDGFNTDFMIKCWKVISSHDIL